MQRFVPVVFCVVALACGGEQFRGTQQGGSGGSGTGGLSSGGSGASSSGGSGGRMDAGGSDASAGCACGDGKYCVEGTSECRDCSDFARLEFGPPEQLLPSTSHPDGSVRFPRAGGPERQLFYRAGTDQPDTASTAARVWFTSDFEAEAGLAVSAGLGTASGPILAGTPEALNLLFDTAEQVGQDRDIFLATWTGSELVGASPAPMPFNPLDSDLRSDYSVAVASSVQRAWWMSAREGLPTLVTAAIAGVAGSEVPVDVFVRTATGQSCPIGAEDATPWVTADGSLLLFRSLTYEASCSPSGASGIQLYAAALNPANGQPSGPAVSVSTHNGSSAQSVETDPSLSSDSCWLYFASNREADDGSSFLLYRAPRR